MTKTQLACAAALLMACTAAGAQVFKCSGANGHTTYSDAPCATGTTGRKVERHYTLDEIQRERQVAASAEARKQARAHAEMLEEWEAQQRALASQAAAPQPSGSDWQRRKDAENAATSAGSITNNRGKWDRAAEAEREKRRRARDDQIAPVSPSVITHCDTGFCYDNLGGAYHQIGGGMMSGPNGQACNRVGDTLHCN